MCILCVIQKWSRRIATMLPWLVIPLIALWALSQLFPPPFRFEITSTRLACVLVLLVTLFWYEVLMPFLSTWRTNRNIRIRDKKRTEAIEMQKLRKTATRRCRNCLTAYRDQNPGGGKFMCTYCGHISKKPILDFPVSPGNGNSGILKDLVGIGGKILRIKTWCGHEWIENGGPFSGNSSYWKKNGGRGLFSGDDDPCLAEKFCSRVFILFCRALTWIFLCVVWLWRKIFRLNSSGDDASADVDGRGMLGNRGENGASSQKSRVEKSRRKAEDKRQARLVKELLDEEERKQREEVSRLVEERRKLRDEKMEIEKDFGKMKDSKRESERKRHERKKERDKGSSKSNSDVEELEKRAGKHNSSSRNFGHGFKAASAGMHNGGNAGTRYFDRMRGTFLSSSRAFTGGSFFGKGTNTSTVNRDHKSSMYRKEILLPDRVTGRGGDDKSPNRPVFIESQPCTPPKKSWQQLFTRSSSYSPPTFRPTGNCMSEVQSTPISGHPTSTQSFDNTLNMGLPNPFGLPSSPLEHSCGSTIPPISSVSMLPKMLDSPHQLLPEVFEDPCYVPDPKSLLGPVSDSLDNFQLDLGFAMGPVKSETKSAVTKPSPIESPLSRSRVSDERYNGSPKAEDNSNNVNNNGTWEMWNSIPLAQDGLGIVGGPVISWHLYPEMNMQRKEDHFSPVPPKTMASLFKKDEQTSSGNYQSHDVLLGHSQNVDGPWFPQTLFGLENKFLLEPVQNGLVYGSSSSSAANHKKIELPLADSWPRKDHIWGMQDGIKNPPASGSHIGGLYTAPDVQSLW